MKTIGISSILLLLIQFNLLSQSIPDGVGGIKFGMSPEDVRIAWESKGTLYQNYKEIANNIGNLVYSNVIVGSEKFDMCSVKFVNNKLFDITFMKLPEKDAEAQDIYDKLVEILESKWGKGRSFRNFSGIYEDGDGYEMQAVRNGNADICTYWEFGRAIISLKIKALSNSVYIEMVYQSQELYKDVKKILDNTNNKDF